MAQTTSRSGKTPDHIDGLAPLSELTEKNNTKSIVCVKVLSASEPLTSRSGWKYRRLGVEDGTMQAEMLISEDVFSEWKFRADDYLACRARSGGLDTSGRLTIFYSDFLEPLEASRLIFLQSEKLRDFKNLSGERMRPAETVYQISAREAKSLLELIRLWASEGKPQHYTKWCQMHQIVATNLYYMGLVKRTGSMSGFYYPTEEALKFFEGKKNLPKKRVFTRGPDGRHVLASEEGESKSFADYLHDYSDRESALQEYRDALRDYQNRIKQQEQT
jgi:hypothetical protein